MPPESSLKNPSRRRQTSPNEAGCQAIQHCLLLKAPLNTHSHISLLHSYQPWPGLCKLSRYTAGTLGPRLPTGVGLCWLGWGSADWGGALLTGVGLCWLGWGSADWGGALLTGVGLCWLGWGSADWGGALLTGVGLCWLGWGSADWSQALLTGMGLCWLGSGSADWGGALLTGARLYRLGPGSTDLGRALQTELLTTSPISNYGKAWTSLTTCAGCLLLPHPVLIRHLL